MDLRWPSHRVFWKQEGDTDTTRGRCSHSLHAGLEPRLTRLYTELHSLHAVAVRDSNSSLGKDSDTPSCSARFATEVVRLQPKLPGTASDPNHWRDGFLLPSLGVYSQHQLDRVLMYVSPPCPLSLLRAGMGPWPPALA